MRRPAAVIAAVALVLGAITGCTAAAPSSSPIVLDRYIASVSVAADPEAEVRIVAGQLGYGPTTGPSIGVAESATVVNGGSIQHTLSSSSAFRTIRFAIDDLDPDGPEPPQPGLPDFGYYEIVLSSAVFQATVVLTVPQSLPDDEFVMYFRAEDAVGRGGPLVAQSIGVVPVGTGDVQVSVSWDVDSDLDLHVVEPGGEVVYYGATQSMSGGTLDLDSNAGCSIDSVRNENVTWPAGDAPSGEYQVVINLYSACGEGPTSYVVTVTVGGSTQTYSGVATGSGFAGDPGEGDLVATFRVG